MSKPDDIPQDVWDAARERAASIRVFPDEITEIVARSILAERGRCFRELLRVAEYDGRKNLIFRTEALDAIRNPSPAADAPRGASISPAPLGAPSNDDFATIPHEGIVR
jgi:hypothetical protein